MIVAGVTHLVDHRTPSGDQTRQVRRPGRAEGVANRTVQIKVQPHWVRVVLAFYRDPAPLVKFFPLGESLRYYFVFLELHRFLYFATKFSANESAEVELIKLRLL
jgi:hypothetical protein